MRGVCTSLWGSLAGTHWDDKNWVILWGSPAGMLSSKRGWLWCLTLPENGDMLLCTNTPFLTQYVLKSWWTRTYQNSAIKRASARAVPGRTEHGAGGDEDFLTPPRRGAGSPKWTRTPQKTPCTRTGRVWMGRGSPRVMTHWPLCSLFS